MSLRSGARKKGRGSFGGTLISFLVCCKSFCLRFASSPRLVELSESNLGLQSQKKKKERKKSPNLKLHRMVQCGRMLAESKPYISSADVSDSKAQTQFQVRMQCA
ncbi:hypothetical protein FQA47_000686 [Oryzias melastigma]|uniref:Uncharacterized protein n=1 Tax=Oryzias melastigma TaxID=30732 RepID=A0A834BSC7_ORYME|nr:hypothetical protein FQA47_000686 [Oryzias melastigma]